MFWYIFGKFVIVILLWRDVHGYVRIYNIAMFNFMINDMCYICKLICTHAEKYYDHLHICSSIQ